MSDTDSPGRVSVVIPVHRGGPSFRECLAGFADADPPPHEIIVVADGAEESDMATAGEFGVKALTTPGRAGPASARNLGAHVATGDIVFFVDADVVVPPDVIETVAGVFGREPHVAAVFGSYDDAPAKSNFLSQYKNLSHHYYHQTAKEDASTFWSGCGAVRRDAFLDAGGFEEAYGDPCIEDIEFGYRLRQAGHNIWLHKALQVKHLKEWRIVGFLKAEIFARAVPWAELILRHRRPGDDLNLRLSARASLVAAYGMLIALAAALVWPASVLVAGGLAIVFLLLNARLYLFFCRKRGPVFALMTIPWNWFYYLYGGLGFAIGVVRHLLRPRQAAGAEAEGH